MDERQAEIHITKLAAAERQLRAAIRVFFLGEDELAIHSVAAAAYGLIKDLKSDRGRDEAADTVLNSVFYAVRDFRRGTLPGYLRHNPATLAWIQNTAAQIPISADSEFTDMTASLSREAAKNYWEKRNAAANFLKHADRDPSGHLSLDQIDNVDLLMQACGAYIDIAQDNLYPEGYVLWLFFCVTNGIADDLADEHQQFVGAITPLQNGWRIAYCSRLIGELKENNG